MFLNNNSRVENICLPETSVAEGLGVVLSKALRIERGLKVLEGQRKIEDIGIYTTKGLGINTPGQCLCW